MEMRLLERELLPAGGQEFTFFPAGPILSNASEKRGSTALLRQGGGGGDDEAGGRVD